MKILCVTFEQDLSTFIRTNADSVAQLLESGYPQAFKAVKEASKASSVNSMVEAERVESGRAGEMSIMHSHKPVSTLKYCKCGQCSAESVGLERRCCRQMAGDCFTTTRRFHVVVLDDDVVKTAVNLERHTERDHMWSYKPAAMRYQAYRQFVFTVTGPTGKWLIIVLFFYSRVDFNFTTHLFLIVQVLTDELYRLHALPPQYGVNGHLMMKRASLFLRSRAHQGAQF